jgi:hypothetical protein
MSDELFFSNIVTKSLEPISSEERYFEGYLTVEVKDKQGEITIVDELYKVLPVWMDRGAPISDTHSNRIVGKGINFSRAVYKNQEGDEIPAIKITGKIHKNYELDNDIWGKIKSGEYKGLSFGGATKSDRTPKVLKDGSVAYALKDLEHYEVAVCKDPAVPLALITDFNPIAKSMVEGTVEDRDGKMVIKCSKFGCSVDLLKDESKRLEQIGDTIGEMKEEDKLREENNKVITEEEQAVKDKKVAPSKLTTAEVAPNNKLHVDDLVAEKADFSNAGGDNASTMYNQDGGKQRPKSDTVVDDKDYIEVKRADLNEYQTFEEKVQALMREGKSRKSAEKIVGSFAKKGEVGGEVPPQWTGSGSPYPNTDEKRVVKRRKIIKTESWHELRKEAFDLDMQWRVIELVNQADATSGLQRKETKPQTGKQIATPWGMTAAPEEAQTKEGQSTRARTTTMRDRFGEGNEKLQDIKNAALEINKTKPKSAKTVLAAEKETQKKVEGAFGDTSAIRGDKVKEPYKYHKEGERQEGTSGGKVSGKKHYNNDGSDDNFPPEVGHHHKLHNTPTKRMINNAVSELIKLDKDLKKNLKF